MNRSQMYEQLYGLPDAPEFGWEVIFPVLLMIGLISLGVPVWVVLGLGSVSMLWFTEALPMGLIGEALFDGIDSFALIAIPLFILTGDVLVRTKLSNKLLDVAHATTGGLNPDLEPPPFWDVVFSPVFQVRMQQALLQWAE